MEFLEQHQNEFLYKWIYGKLTKKELNTFVTSALYKKLVFSSASNGRNQKEGL